MNEVEDEIKLARKVSLPTKLSLYARSAGRCEFNGCNRILYKSPVTQESVDISQKAHIYSIAKYGPRGWEKPNMTNEEINHIDNLILVCHDCHKKIDNKNGERYPATSLKKWKKQHEERIFITSGIAPNRKSHVILYGSNIGEQKSILQKIDAHETLFAMERYPAQEHPTELSMQWSNQDSAVDFWTTESNNLRTNFENKIARLIEENNPCHFSLFALAPIPLLMQLGCHFTDKIDVDVHQPKREPKTWKWQVPPEKFEFIIKQPADFNKQPVLVISLSGKIDPSRIHSVLGDDVSIWELTAPEGHLHNDSIRAPEQLSQFRKVVRKLMVDINEKHGNETALSIFPAMPVSCAVEMGRVRMPKADMPWIIYDQSKKNDKFIKALTIGI